MTLFEPKKWNTFQQWRLSFIIIFLTAKVDCYWINMSTSTRFCSHYPKYCWMQVWKCHHVRTRILSFPLSLFGWFFSFAIYCNNFPPTPSSVKTRTSATLPTDQQARWLWPACYQVNDLCPLPNVKHSSINNLPTPPLQALSTSISATTSKIGWHLNQPESSHWSLNNFS